MNKLLFFTFFFLVSLYSFSQSIAVGAPPGALFENHDISNMVNLATGDFHYNLNVLEIPGPEGGYPVSLGYQAGIKVSQEASWIGLGWNLESNAITRSIAQVPDDYRGAVRVTSMKDPGGREEIDNPNTLERFFQWQSLAYLYTFDGFLVGVGLKEDPLTDWGEYWDNYYLKALKNSSWITGFGNPVSGTITLATLFHVPQKGPKPSFNPLPWDWTVLEYNYQERFLWIIVTEDIYQHRWFLNRRLEERQYGMLYQSDIPYNTVPPNSLNYFNPQFNDGTSQVLQAYNEVLEFDSKSSLDALNAASDYYQRRPVDTTLVENLNPIYWASDFYVVSTKGVFGEIRPFRYDNSSVATSFPSNRFYDKKIALTKYRISQNESNSKVQFAFVGDQSNYFDYPEEAFDGDYALKYTEKSVFDDELNQNVTAPFFTNQSEAIIQSEETRFGYNGDNHLIRGKNVKWYSNQEISKSEAFEDGFLDYKANRIRPDSLFPSYGIGGFVVTDENGVNYHFALPEYTLFETTQTLNDAYVGIDTLDEPYAHKWLLTAITGPNFVDSGDIPGVLDHADEGYFVKFEYGKFTDHFYRQYPKDGLGMYTPTNGEASINSITQEQNYYLNQISTRTHTAVFIKDIRTDNQSSVLESGPSDEINVRSLALDRILLFRKDDFTFLKNSLGFGSLPDSDYFERENEQVIFKKSDITKTNAIQEFIKKHALRTVVFNQSRGLMIDKNLLNSVKFLGLDSVSSIPEFNFYYNDVEVSLDNSRYNWDGWGHYKDNSGSGPESHQVDPNSRGDEWSLSKIHTPSGQIISISYERDTYQKISGVELSVERLGGDIRVKSIEGIQNGNIVKDEYFYTLDGTEDGLSSGVASDEPSFINTESPVGNFYGYPSPSVIYSQVNRKRYSENGNLLSRISVEFHVPADSTMTVDTLYKNSTVVHPDVENDSYKYGYKLNEASYLTINRQDLIGKPIKILKYDANNVPLTEAKYEYEESPYGQIAQALHLFDQTYRNYFDGRSEDGKKDKRITARFINSISKDKLYRLTKINFKNFLSNQNDITHYKNFDFYTGAPKTVISTDGYGNHMASVSVPAYTKDAYTSDPGNYSGMEPAGLGGKNMLNQVAENYSYKLADLDYSNNPAQFTELLSGSIQTWDHEGAIWRPKSSYFLNKGSLNADGTVQLLNAEDEFRFDLEEQADHWVRSSEIVSYDAYSKPVESMNVSGMKASSRYSADKSFVVASASGLELREFAFCSAEKDLSSEEYASEVNPGSGTRTDVFKHAGEYSLKVPAASPGFSYTFKPGAENGEKVYRVSVWVHESEVQDLRLHILFNGATHNQYFDVSGKPNINGWYLFEADMDLSKYVINDASEVTFRFFNGGSQDAYVDDFRVIPVEAPIACFTYNKLGKREYVLDENHFFTKYEYDGFGRIRAVYQETNDGVIKLNQYEYNHTSN